MGSNINNGYISTTDRAQKSTMTCEANWFRLLAKEMFERKSHCLYYTFKYVSTFSAQIFIIFVTKRML